MNIRAITLMVGEVYGKDINEAKNIVENVVQKFLELIGELKSELRIWTIRLSLPYVDPNIGNVERYAEVFEDLAERYSIDFVSSLHFKSDDSRVWDLPNALLNNKRSFGSIVLRSYDDLLSIARIFENLNEDNGYKLTAIWGETLTPYFPASKAPIGSNGISYTPFIVEEYLASKNLTYVEEKASAKLLQINALIEDLAEKYGLKFYGVDLSPSPWMDVSVAKVVERLGETRFGDYGTLHGVWVLSKSIGNIASKLRDKITGFNEVMLAVAEDNVLKERAVEGTYTVKDLIQYSFACVYGVDMVPVSKPVGYRRIAKVLYDLKVASEVKGKPVGFRIIPVNAEPGSIVDLGFFGHTPVFKL